jgi:hypothetical protein
MLSLLCTLVAGALASYVLFGGKAVRAGNEMRFIVHPAGVYFSPDGGDVIKWFMPDQKTAVYAHFIGSSPCREGLDTDTCTIKKRAGGTFKYFCTDKSGAKTLCDDPGIDPNSDTGTSRVAGPVGDAITGPQAASKTTNLVAAGPTSKLLVVACNKKDLVLYYGTSPVVPPNYPTVLQNDVIEWDSDIDIGVSITFDTVSDCTGDLSANPATCTMNKAGPSTTTYHIIGTCQKQPAKLDSAFNVK